MNKELTSYIITLGMAASVLIGLDIAIHYIKPEMHPFQFGSGIIVLMFLVYAFSFSYLLKIHAKEPKKFINAYMAFSGIRIMTLAILVVVIFVLAKAYMKEAAIILMASYLLFTIVEWKFSKNMLKGQD